MIIVTNLMPNYHHKAGSCSDFLHVYQTLHSTHTVVTLSLSLGLGFMCLCSFALL